MLIAFSAVKSAASTELSLASAGSDSGKPGTSSAKRSSEDWNSGLAGERTDRDIAAHAASLRVGVHSTRRLGCQLNPA